MSRELNQAPAEDDISYSVGLAAELGPHARVPHSSNINNSTYSRMRELPLQNSTNWVHAMLADSREEWNGGSARPLLQCLSKNFPGRADNVDQSGRALGVNQDEVSKIEHRTDLYLSTAL
jgi:hypothetical protein